MDHKKALNILVGKLLTRVENIDKSKEKNVTPEDKKLFDGIKTLQKQQENQ